MQIFHCPICHAALAQNGNSLICSKHHCFDRAAEGYYHLLPSNRMHAKIPGDNKEMVAARRQFLQAGYYQIFSDGINTTAIRLLEGMKEPTVLDAGCGEGYYTARLGNALRQYGFCPRMGGFDISKFAVKSAAKQDKETSYAVASIFDIPVETESCDLLLNIFAPIVPEEFAKALKEGGFLLIAVPSKRHLFGLKEILYDQPYENEQLDTDYPGFTFLERIPIRGEIALHDPLQIQNLFSMTPYYWKTPPSGCERLKEQTVLTTEIGFDLLIYQRNKNQ